MVGCLGWENAWVVTYERFIIKNLMVNLASQTSSLPWKIHRVHMFAQSSQALWWVDMSHWYFFESNILSSGCFMRIFNQRDYPDDNVKELVKSHLLYTKRPVRLGLYNTIIQASVSKVGVAKGLKQANFTRTELKDQVWWFFCNTYNWSSRFESSVGKFFQHLIFFGGGGETLDRIYTRNKIPHIGLFLAQKVLGGEEMWDKVKETEFHAKKNWDGLKFIIFLFIDLVQQNQVFQSTSWPILEPQQFVLLCGWRGTDCCGYRMGKDAVWET